MKRIIKIPDTLQELKYELIEEYKEWGIYQRKCLTGYFVNQDYLISNGKLLIQIESYNNMCKAEILDAIDNYDSCGKFGFKAFKRTDGYCVHSNGNINI